MISNKDLYIKTPIIWRANEVDYNINHIISVKPWYNSITKINGLKVRLVNGDVDTICFRQDYDRPEEGLYWHEHKSEINQATRECWEEWCSIVNMSKDI